MKYRNIILKIVLFSLILASCDEQIMEWEKDPSHGEITEAEIPVSTDEKLSRYEALNTYANFALGVGIGLEQYMDNETYRGLTNENFDEVTVGYAMKHAAMVNTSGEINFQEVDTFLKEVKAAGLSTFGHTLVWHSNQNATYLNGLIAATVLPDTAGSGNIKNLLSNGTCDAGVDSWAKINGAADALSHVTGAEAYEGDGAMKVVNDSDNPSDQWKTQIQASFIESPVAGEEYTVSFMIRSDAIGSIRCSTVGDEQYQGDQSTSTSWSLISWDITVSGDETGISLDLGKVAGTYYIDNLKFAVKSESSGGTITIELTEEEKTEIIGNAMESFISGMVSHYKNDITAWDVVNEPMKENGVLRDGEVDEISEDQFYWVKYLGKDYAVTAFNLARQYGNASDIMFINDYNLEYSLDKCDGLIDYVEYIESQGAQVDGIGTQMHISIDSDSSKIEQMFQKLAATGKLIKISELDVRLGTADPTPEQLEAQSIMYRYVIDMYMKYIPSDQQYGITIWGISDNPDEHEYWLPDESPNLWDADYQRKPAYIGVANGLAGRDISEDFTGELQY